MIFANGKRYPSQQQDEILNRLEEELNQTLSFGTPPASSQVIDACEALINKTLTGMFNEELNKFGLESASLKERIAEAAALMSRHSLTAKVREELGEDFSVRRTVYPPSGNKRPLIKRRIPLGVLFHISAGNVDGLPAFSVIEGLLSGNINILKLPSADHGLSLRMMEELVKAQPELAPYVYVFDTPSDDLAAMKRMAALADGIVVWGGDAATEAVRALAPAGVKLIEWGHKLSFAYATEDGIGDDDLRALAKHIMDTRQLLCSSCQTLFYDTEDKEKAAQLCRRMLPFLEEAASQVSPLDAGSAAQVSLQLYTQILEGWAGHSSRKVFRGQGCSVTLCEEGPPELSPQFGNLLVKPLPRSRLLSTLRKKKTHLQTAGLLCGDGERQELTDLLFRAGILRVTGPGSMSHTTALDAHDGEYPLLRYTRIVEQRP